MTDRRAPSWMTMGGLAFAFLAPLLALECGQALFGSTQSPSRVGVGLVLHWLTLGLMILIVRRAERESFASIGVKPFRWWTIPFGVLAGVVIVFTAGILTSVLHLSTNATYAGFLQSLPAVTRLLVATTAGLFEETLYRGYALERLATLTGNKWLAAITTLLIFTVMHGPAMGWSHLWPVAIMGGLVTLLYLWRRNLILNIVAHATIDAFGLLVAPLISPHSSG